MSTTVLMVIVLLIVSGFIAGVAWFCLFLFKRAKKAYWDLYHKVVQVEQLVEQSQQNIEQKIEQLHQHVKQVEHHLLLEHMAEVAARAKEYNLIDSDTYDKSVQLFHELEMDNFQGKKILNNK